MINVREGRLKALYSVRDKLANAIDNITYLKDLAPLTKQLVDVLEQIEVIEKKIGVNGKETALDELAERRKARLSETNAQMRTKKRASK